MQILIRTAACGSWNCRAQRHATSPSECLPPMRWSKERSMAFGPTLWEAKRRCDGESEKFWSMFGAEMIQPTFAISRSPDSQPPKLKLNVIPKVSGPQSGPRSEEHTSELQSIRHIVCTLL